MNLNELLAKILDIASYPQDKRESFVRDFYNYYLTRLIDSVGGVDPAMAQKMVYAVDHYRENPEGLNAIWQSLNTEPKMKEIADSVFGEVIEELVDDIVKYSSEVEKQQILALVNAGS